MDHKYAPLVVHGCNLADIVLLYRSHDRATVEKIIAWLESAPWSFWWDQHQATGAWNQEVEKQIRGCRCVLPIWSNASLDSASPVPNEVNYAKNLNQPRVHVRIEDVLLPVHVSLEIYTDLIDRFEFTQLNRRRCQSKSA